MPPGVHAKFGASSYSRWSACPGSIKHLEENPMPSSPYADEGTLAHDMCERMLKGEMVEFKDPDMMQHCKGYVLYCQTLAEGCDDYAIEQSFQLTDDMFGTNDFSCYKEFDVLHIVDFKYGQGIDVQAEGNVQLMFYALGAYENLGLDVERIKLHIYQPRVDNPVKTWEFPSSDLAEFKEELFAARQRVLDNPDLKITGDHCRFCNKAKCPVMIEEVQSVLPPTDTVDLGKVTTEELVKLLSMEKRISSFFKDVRGLLTSQAESGIIDPAEYGMKLVEKTGHRKWTVDKLPYRKLGIKKSDAFESKLKTPTQVAKLLDKDKRQLLDELTERPVTGKSLVTDKAKGEPVKALEISDTLTLSNKDK